MKCCISIPDELFGEIEYRRGFVARSTFIQNALKAYVKTHNFNDDDMGRRF